MLRLDEQIVEQHCSHCGRPFTVSRGSAFDDGEPFALYLAGLHACDGARVAHLAIAIRPGFRDNPTAEAITLRLWNEGDAFAMHVTDAMESPWKDERYLGRMLDRAEALASSLRESVFHIASHLAIEATAVARYLAARE